MHDHKVISSRLKQSIPFVFHFGNLIAYIFDPIWDHFMWNDDS